MDQPSVAYIVSRFPATSETFIVRELSAVEGLGLDVRLFSLFPAREEVPHDTARRWVHRVRRPTPRRIVRSLTYWLSHRPVPTLRVFGRILWAYRSHGRFLLRAVATTVIATATARDCNALGVRHVHAHFASYPALAAWVVKRLAGCSYSFTAHAHDLFMDQALLAPIVDDAEFVVAISEFNRRFLHAYGGDVATPVHVVHCGIDVARYPFRDRSIAETGPVRTLCVAGLREYKGHRVLLEALADHRLERLTLDLIGAGPLRAQLETHVERLGLRERVRFLGTQSEEQVEASIRRADLFVLPSVVASDRQMEGIPVALMEAMAGGLPVVSTRLSGIPELVQPGVTGLLADPDDVSSLADVLADTLTDPEGAKTRARAARGMIEQQFAIEDTGSRMASLISAASGDDGATRPRTRT